MNFAVLLVPDFALHALRCSEPALRHQPVALIDGEGRKAVLTEVSPEAEGVTPGLAVTLAMARCPGIVLRPRDPTAETVSNRLLVAAAFSLSPRVEATTGGCCTVDLQGADPVKTTAALHERVAELTRLGLPARAGVGATPLLAFYAARCATPVLVVGEKNEFLQNLPLAFAGPTAEQAGVLDNWGIRTLGQLTALPKAEIGRRLGTDGVAMWERAAGEATRVLRLTPPAVTFAARWDYEPPIENLEPLLFKLRRFAECLAFELRGAGFVAQALALTLLLENETDYRREFSLAEPGTDVDGWLKVMHAHLETLKLPSRLIAAQLVATPTRPQVKQDGLFETGLRDPHSFWENFARVAAILGSDRLSTPVPSDSWRPDSFTLEKPAESVPAPAAPLVHPPRGGVLRRFRPPRPMLVVLENARPADLSGAVGGRVRTVAGPWRSSGGWWQPEGWAVETWHVELARGGVYQLVRTADGWTIEGEID